jgi:hypothetical protein
MAAVDAGSHYIRAFNRTRQVAPIQSEWVSAILSGSLEPTKHMRCYADTDSLQHQFDGRLICMLFLLNREIFIRSQHYMCRAVIG